VAKPSRAAREKEASLVRPAWKIWALAAVLAGCLVTLGATLNDIF